MRPLSAVQLSPVARPLSLPATRFARIDDGAHQESGVQQHLRTARSWFQRQSAWKERDRAKLIESILRNYPLPAIFLYRREEDGKLVYDVIDGKQRLESILM